MAAADVKKVLQLKHQLKESCEGHTVGCCLSLCNCQQKGFVSFYKNNVNRLKDKAVRAGQHKD